MPINNGQGKTYWEWEQKLKRDKRRFFWLAVGLLAALSALAALWL